MHKEMKVLILDSDEQQLLVRSLYDLRNALLQKDSSAEPVKDLLLRVIDAPPAMSRTPRRSRLPIGRKRTRSVETFNPAESNDSAEAMKGNRRLDRETR